MNVLLAIVVFLLSIIGTGVIHFSSVVNLALYLSKKGFKIDKKVMDEMDKELKEEGKKEISELKRIVGAFLFFMPIINMLYAAIKVHFDRKAVIDELKKRNGLFPMTEKEKKDYSEFKRTKDKLLYTVVNTMKENEEEEYIGSFGKNILVGDSGLMKIHSNRIEDLDYTLDDVKRLNEVVDGNYRLGKINNDYIAIIGIGNREIEIKRIQFSSEDYRITHNYDLLTEEEAKDKIFTVYADFLSNEEKEKLDQVIEEIKEERLEKEKPNYSYIPYQVDEDELEIKEEGPVLKKTLGRR